MAIEDAAILSRCEGIPCVRSKLPRWSSLAFWQNTAAEAMPDCRLVIVPGIGHSMNLELPALYAGYFGAWFGGLAA